MDSLLPRLTNPVTLMGLSMLSQGYSPTPRAPLQNVSRGMVDGLSIASKFDQIMNESNRREQMMSLEREKAQRDWEHRQHQIRMQQQKDAERNNFVSSLPAEQQPAARMNPTAFAKPQVQWSEPYNMAGPDGQPMMVKRNLATNEVSRIGGSAVTINQNRREPLGTQAVKWSNAQGHRPSADMTAGEAVAHGFQPTAPEVQATRTDEAKRESQRAYAEQRVADAEAEYQTALFAAESKPTGENRERLELAQSKVMLARQSLENDNRELNENTLQTLKPRGMVERGMDKFIDPFVGGKESDTFNKGETFSLPNGMKVRRIK